MVMQTLLISYIIVLAWAKSQIRRKLVAGNGRSITSALEMHGENVAMLLRTGLNNVVVPIWFNNIAQHCYYSQSDSTMLCNVFLTTVKCEQ